MNHTMTCNFNFSYYSVFPFHWDADISQQDAPGCHTGFTVRQAAVSHCLLYIIWFCSWWLSRFIYSVKLAQKPIPSRILTEVRTIFKCKVIHFIAIIVAANSLHWCIPWVEIQLQLDILKSSQRGLRKNT